MFQFVITLAIVAQLAAGLPWVAEMPGVDLSLLSRRSASTKRQSDQATCPFNAVHIGAAPYNAAYPYIAAQHGVPGTQRGGVQVPAPGDTAQYFTAPGSNDIRGPYPGLNTAVDHNFLGHDSITIFVELVHAQQNLYNVDCSLAVTLATLGVGLDGCHYREALDQP